MRVTKKNQQQNGHREIVDAVKALCSEKDIEPEVLFSAIEEAMKAAYKKNVSRDEDAPSNLSVTMDRNTGDVHVFARKTITDDVEDPANQITLEEALKIRRDYRMGDIAEIDVTPNGFLRTAAQTAKQVIMQRIREAEQGRIYEEYSDKENEILTENAHALPPADDHVVGPLDARFQAGTDLFDGLRSRNCRPQRAEGNLLRRKTGLEQQGYGQRFSRSRFPDPLKPPAAGTLKVAHRHGARGRALTGQLLQQGVGGGNLFFVNDLAFAHPAGGQAILQPLAGGQQTVAHSLPSSGFGSAFFLRLR